MISGQLYHLLILDFVLASKIIYIYLANNSQLPELIIFSFVRYCSTKCSLIKAAVIHLLSCHENDIYRFYYFASSCLLCRSRILEGKTVELANLSYYNGKIAPEKINQTCLLNPSSQITVLYTLNEEFSS